MKRTTALAAAAILLAGASTSFAQSRDFGARRIIFDDGVTSFETRVEATSPMTASGTFTLPDPGVASGTFIMSNSVSGQTITGGLTNNTFFNSNGATTIGNGAGSLTLDLNGNPNAAVTENSWITNSGSPTSMVFENSGLGNMNVGINTTSPAGMLANNATNQIIQATGMPIDGFNWQATAGGWAAQIRNSSTAGNAYGLAIQIGDGAAGRNAIFAEANGLGTIFQVTPGGGYLLGNMNLGTGGYQTNGTMRIANNGDATLAATTTTTLAASGLASLNGAANIGNGDGDVIAVNTTGNFTVASDDFTVDATGNTTADGLLTGGTGVVATTGNINAVAGNLQTNGVTRIANNGDATLGAASVTGQITSTLANGTAPFVLTSSTVSPNLNADMVDGLHGTDLVTLAGDQTITGNKTFPVTAAQGDALISSINAGTTFIDWARIGTAGGALGTFTITGAGQTIPAGTVTSNRVIVVNNASGSNQDLLLPNIGPSKVGHVITIMRANAGGNNFTFDQAAPIFKMFSSQTMNLDYETISYLWDGTFWVETGRNP